MRNLQIFLKTKKPLSPGFLEAKIHGGNFSEFLSEEDACFIEQQWKLRKEQYGEAIFSGKLGSLFDIQGNYFYFKTTEFRDYLAISSSYDEQNMSKHIYNMMRASVVGAAVYCSDGKVFVQRRPLTATHAPGYLDSSVAGFCHPDCKGNLSLVDAVLEKLQRELHVNKDEIDTLDLAGAHSSPAPDFSGGFAFYVTTSLSSEALGKRANAEYVCENHAIRIEHLPDFITHHFAVRGDMIGEGCAVLLASLEYSSFHKTVSRINHLKKKISFGTLKQGMFVEYSNPSTNLTGYEKNL